MPGQHVCYIYKDVLRLLGCRALPYVYLYLLCLIHSTLLPCLGNGQAKLCVMQAALPMFVVQVCDNGVSTAHIT